MNNNKVKDFIELQSSSLDYNYSNFTNFDRCISNPVRQYVRRTEKIFSTFHTKQQILIQLKQVLEYLGVIIVTHEGRVRCMTQRGEQLLSQYFSPYAPRSSLPEALQGWFKQQVALHKANKTSPPSSFPLYVSQEEKQLVIRLFFDSTGEQYLVLLEEQKLPSFSINSLESLGLTKREAEVLFWVARDKSNAAIAKVLDCRQGTVRKHLEHIHRKLGVQTRTAAVVVAVERLGLLRGMLDAASS